ncbi:MAG: SGNH/GDSL hydrolase family protein [Burkholderiaceae bacterium]
MKPPVIGRIAAAIASASVLVLAACGGGSHDDRMQVRSMVVFGDSLSDVGTYAAATGDPRNPGKFTVNPGSVWVENIAAAYGLKLTPNRSLTLDKDASGVATASTGTATVLGGKGYAEGGARIVDYPMQSGIGNNEIVASVTRQIDNYLAANASVPPGELIVLNGGGNDTYAQFAAICWGLDNNGVGAGNTTQAIADEAIARAARQQLANARRLKAAGAQVVLLNLASDWSANPFAAHYLPAAAQASGCYAQVPPTQITTWTAQFNKIVQDGLAGTEGIVVLDADKDFAAVLANPGASGFTNVTDAACNNRTPTDSATFCTTSTLVDPNGSETYLWSDSFHPTPHGHRLISDAALKKLDDAVRK